MNGISSRRRSNGDSEVRYFSRKIEATSSCTSALIRSKRRRNVRRIRELPLAGVVRPNMSMNTAANTTATKPKTVVVFMSAAALAPIVGQRENAHRQIDAADGSALMERRHDTGGIEATEDVALCVDAGTAKREYLRHGDDLALHTADLLNTDQSAATVVAALHLNDDVDRRSYLRTHCTDRK